MPLTFVHAVDNLSKSEFHIQLTEVLESLDKWASSYLLDIELSYKKFKSLERLLSFVPTEEPLFFVEGEHREDLVTNDDLLQLLSLKSNYRLASTLAGNVGGDFVLNIHPEECPFFRGLKYYDTEKDHGKMSNLEIYPLSGSLIDNIDDKTRLSTNTAVFEVPTRELLNDEFPNAYSLRRSLYDLIRAKFNLPPIEEFLKLESFIVPSTNIKMFYGRKAGGSLSFSFPRQHDEKILEIIRSSLTLATKPKTAWLTMVGSFKEISDFLKDKRVPQVFKIRKCGFNTAATGELGHLPGINNDSLRLILNSNKEFADIVLKWNDVRCRITTKTDYESSACLYTSGRKAGYRYDFRLHCDDLESEEFRQFSSAMAAASGLPFENTKNWWVTNYTGRRYKEVITQIERFTREADEICEQIAGNFYELGGNTKYTFEARPMAFPDTCEKHGIKFNNIVKQVMQKRQKSYRYDKDASTPIWARVGFINKNSAGIYCYLTFRGDPKLRNKEFDVELEVRTVPMKQATWDPPQWKYSANLTELFGERCCWYFDSEEQLIEQANNAVDFIEDIGEEFFQKVGDLLQNFYRDAKNTIQI